MCQRFNTLILAPHIDDEVIGCFTFLKPRTFVHCFGAEDRSYVSRGGRIAELAASATKAGFAWHVGEHECQRYDCSTLIPEIEKKINDLKPKILLIPQPDYNQDHRAVYDAAIAAMRPHDTNHLVPIVLQYEQPHSLMWPNGSTMREPNYFQVLDIEAKLQLYSLYASQVRAHRSPELLTALARLRGASIKTQFAEAFYCKRIIASS